MQNHQQQWQELDISELYISKKEKFYCFIKKLFHLNHHDIEDIYQESFGILIKNIERKKPKERTCSPETFLFGIGKNLSHMLKRKQMKESNIDISRILYFNEIDEIAWKEKWEKIEKCLKQEKYQVITLFYLNGMSIEEIKIEMQYKNQNTAKSMKCKLMNKLRTQVSLAV